MTTTITATVLQVYWFWERYWFFGYGTVKPKPVMEIRDNVMMGDQGGAILLGDEQA